MLLPLCIAVSFSLLHSYCNRFHVQIFLFYSYIIPPREHKVNENAKYCIARAAVAIFGKAEHMNEIAREQYKHIRENIASQMQLRSAARMQRKDGIFQLTP